MKNNKLFLSILIIFIAALIILIALGYKTRIGYLTEFKFDEYHINRTLELNGLNIDEVKKTFTIDNTLNNEALINYIFTNEAITNYSYGYKVGYYSKVFKHSDLYGVYPNTNKILIDNNFLKEIKMDKPGSPFGNLISEKILKYDEKIDNINYKLKVKFTIYLIFILILIILMILSNAKYFNTIIYSPKNSDYITFSIITILCFFSYIYSDVLVIFPFSVNFFNVNPLNFFYEVYQKVGSYHKPDDLPYLSYVLYSILFLPLWIYSKIKNITYYTWHHEQFEIGTFEIIYIKFLLLLFVILSSIIIYKICKKIGFDNEKSKLSSFMFITSPFTMIPVFIISQVEIIMIFFTLLGILDYLNNNKRYLLWFAIAIPLKLFPFFILIPLVLLKEKQIKKIALYTIIPILPYIISSIIFKSPNPSDRNLVAFGTLMGYKIFGVSIFIIIYSLICLFSYLKDIKNNNEFNKLTLYISFFVLSLITIVNTNFHMYWIVILSPFMAILLLFSRCNIVLKIIVEFIATLFYAIYTTQLASIISMHEALRTKSIPFIKLFVHNNKYYSIREIFPNFFGNPDIVNAIYSFFIMGIIILLILYYKYNNDNDDISIPRYLVYIRFIPTLFIIFLIWYLGLR
ncbi:hypothetical protein R4J03_14425 [Brachyspira intermedia]|uniref:hypothetical protein n=1 Tax=Brachyspira intermedia TaxID=84377 RepID=UPI003007A046